MKLKREARLSLPQILLYGEAKGPFLNIQVLDDGLRGLCKWNSEGEIGRDHRLVWDAHGDQRCLSLGPLRCRFSLD